MTLREQYEETLDFLAYFRTYAPNLPSTGKLTMKSAFEEAFDHVERLTSVEDNDTSQKWLKLSRLEVEKAEKEFEQGKDREGRKFLEAGKTYVQNAASRKSMTPTIVLDQPGFAE